MISRLYTGSIRHRRYIGKRHRFRYRLFFLFLDLDKLTETFKPYWFWSNNRRNIAYFDRRHYFGNSSHSLADSVREKFTSNGLTQPEKIYLLTNLSYFGYCFNPISIYFCMNNNELTHCLIEITNTPWLEQTVHLVKMNKISKHGYEADFDKKLHVSPFLSMDYNYQMRCHFHDKHLGVHIENQQNNEIHFDATLSLDAHEINHWGLAKVLLTYPFLTCKIYIAIRYQALRLWLKGNRVFNHP